MLQQDTIPATSYDTIVPVDSIDIPDTTRAFVKVNFIQDSAKSYDTASPEIISGGKVTSSISADKYSIQEDTLSLTSDTSKLIADPSTGLKSSITLKPASESANQPFAEKETVHKSDTFLIQKIDHRPIFTKSVLVSTPDIQNGISGQAIQKGIMTPDWYFFILMGTLIIIAWIRSVYGGILIKTYQASVNFSVTMRMFKDNSVLQKQLDDVLIGIYFISTGLYLYLLESKFELYPYGLQGIQLLLLNIGFLIAIFYGRILIASVIGFLFRQQRIIEEYRYNISVFNKLLGVIIIPFLLFIFYSNGIVKNALEWLSLYVAGAVFLLRIYRSFIFSLKKDVLILYLFLYLCALEIVPIMVLFKWIDSIV